MATYDRNSLVRDVLLEIGQLDPNEAPEAVDFETVDARAQQKLEELYEEGLIPFDLDGLIPARYFIPLVRIIAETVYGTYGVSMRAEEFIGNAIEATKQLRRLRQRAYCGTPTQATYF